MNEHDSQYQEFSSMAQFKSRNGEKDVWSEKKRPSKQMLKTTTNKDFQSLL
jgi:hypothetical protein